MGFKIKLLLIFCAVGFMRHSILAQTNDAEGSTDHVLVPRLENFYIANYKENRFDFENFKTSNGSVRVEGHKFVIDHRLQQGLTPKGKNFILESFQKLLDSPETNLMLKGPYYFVFKITNSDTETWVKVEPLNTDGNRYTLTIVEKEKISQEISSEASPSITKNSNDIEGSSDYPLLPRMPDFYIDRFEETEQASETFKTSNGNKNIEGHKIYIDYYLEEGKVPPGKIHILENYRTVLRNSGAEILLDGAYYDVYKVQASSGETWIKIDPGNYDGKRYEVTVVEKPGIAPNVASKTEIIRTNELTMTGLNPEERILKTYALQMTGLNPNDRIISASALKMTGLNSEDRIIKTRGLKMTGLNPSDRIIKTNTLLMTGLE